MKIGARVISLEPTWEIANNSSFLKGYGILGLVGTKLNRFSRPRTFIGFSLLIK